MNETISLKQKSDTHLLSDLKTLVAKERELLTQVLNHLKEVEVRGLYLARGYSSLFSYMTEELRYAESSAQRRIQAMRLIKELPEVQEKIEKGVLSLTVASQVSSFFRQETQKRQQQKEAPISREEKLYLIQELQGSSARACEKKLAQIAPESSIPKEKTRPITEDKFQIQFTANKKLMQKIDKLKSLLSNQNEAGSLENLFEKITEIALDKLDPERRECRRRQRLVQKTSLPNISPPAQKAKPATRYIPRALRDQIWVRDQGQCQYRDPKTGKTCGSKHFLEHDHRYPYALGGEHSYDNLILKCRKHNQWRATILFGEK